MSPACVGRTGSDLPATCIACQREGFHDHIYWECKHVENKIGMKRPKVKDLWQKRYGWPEATPGSGGKDLEVLLWMRAVTLEIWNQRYGKEEAEERKRKGMEAKIKEYKDKEKAYLEDEAEDALTKWLMMKAELEDEALEDSEEEELEKEDEEPMSEEEKTESRPRGSTPS